jgi:precorrin-2 dehydrogenase / sirohydrochlorin ferrochelatase
VKPYPVMMNLEGKRVLVVGGGKVAARKVGSLLESGALVTVVSPTVDRELEHLARESRIEWISACFEDSVLDRYSEVLLLFGATNSRETNLRIYRAAGERKIPCNIADVPDLCTFIVPAVFTRGDLMIAVSTGGSSPALARRIREDLEKRFGPEYATMTKLLAKLRKQILETGSSSDENRKLFREIVDSEILTALREQDRDRALEILRAILPDQVNPEPAMEAPAQNSIAKE